MNAVESSSSTSSDEALQLDYDKRMRAPPLETSAKAALAEFEQTQQRVRDLFGGDDSSASSTSVPSMPVSSDLDKAVSLSATTPAEVVLGSTLGREVISKTEEIANVCELADPYFDSGADVVRLSSCHTSLCPSSGHFGS